MPTFPKNHNFKEQADRAVFLYGFNTEVSDWRIYREQCYQDLRNKYKVYISRFDIGRYSESAYVHLKNVEDVEKLKKVNNYRDPKSKEMLARIKLGGSNIIVYPYRKDRNPNSKRTSRNSSVCSLDSSIVIGSTSSSTHRTRNEDTRCTETSSSVADSQWSSSVTTDDDDEGGSLDRQNTVVERVKNEPSRQITVKAVENEENNELILPELKKSATIFDENKFQSDLKLYLPDIFWQLDVRETYIKILRTVYGNSKEQFLRTVIQYSTELSYLHDQLKNQQRILQIQQLVQTILSDRSQYGDISSLFDSLL